MTKVEILKTINECRPCDDIAQMCGVVPPCNTCKNTTAEWIDTVTNFWDTYAILKREDGKIVKVPISGIRVIEEV